MNVLILNQAFYPDPVATAQQITDLALFLKGKGCQVTVLAGKRAYHQNKIKYMSRENYKGIDVRRLFNTGFGKKKIFHRLTDALTFELSVLWALIWMKKRDVIIAFTTPPFIGLMGVLFTMLKGGRLVHWLMDAHPETAFVIKYIKRNSIIAKILTAIFSFTLKHSHHIVVLDRIMKKKMLQYGAKDHQFTIIPPWPIDGEKIIPIPFSENNFRKKYSLENKFVVLYSGNHSIAHPLNTLLEAALHLRKMEKIVFVFIGSGIRTDEVTDFKKRHDLTNIIQFPYQPREFLNHSLTSANLHVISMGEEMSGLVHNSKLYGILATGRPYVFIGPKESHICDLLTECPYGFHVEHGEVETLEKIINTVYQFDDEQYAKFEEKNTEYLLTHFGSNKSLHSFLTQVLYEKPDTEIGRVDLIKAIDKKWNGTHFLI